MTRDKLITVRIEDEVRDRFNRWAKDNNSDSSTIIYEFIKQCLDGKIDANLVMGKIVLGIDAQRLDALDKFTDSLYKQIDDMARQISRIDGQLDNVLTRDEHETAIASLQSEIDELKKLSA